MDFVLSADTHANLIQKTVRCLVQGGIALLPTDTVYGLAVSPENSESVDRVYYLKQRPREKNLPIMVGAEFDLESIGVQLTIGGSRLLASPFVPGPLTLAFGIVGSKAPSWLNGRDEIAIRIPNSEFMLEVLKRTGPLLVTSANAHGQPTERDVVDITSHLDGKPDLTVDGGRLNAVPSTLVNCRRDPPVVEREGAISIDALSAYLR